MRYLITGGAGFIGSHLSDELLARGHSVHILIDLAHRIIKAVDTKSEITLVPYDEAYEEGFEDMLRRIPDIHKIGQLLGWQPRVPLDGIISDVVDAHRTAAVV